MARVKEAHGAAGPWAVAGYRIGERAIKDLGLPRHSHHMDFVHHSPLMVQYSCMADGLSAATGASPSKLNLRIEETTVSGLQTVIRDRERGRSLTFTLKPEFVRSISDLPGDRPGNRRPEGRDACRSGHLQCERIKVAADGIAPPIQNVSLGLLMHVPDAVLSPSVAAATSDIEAGGLIVCSFPPCL